MLLNKLYSTLSVIVLIFICSNSTAETIAKQDDSLPNCAQIYIDTPSLPGTQEQCKQNWDYFVKHNNYYAMAIMTLDGLGGQRPDPKKALVYAKKIDLGTNINPNVGPMPGEDTKASLISKIEDKLSKSTDAKSSVNDCDLMEGDTQQIAICSEIEYQNYVDKAKYDNDLLAKKLSAKQGRALSATLDTYLSFLSKDDDLRFSIGQFQGSGRDTWSINSQQIMLDFYNKSINNLLKHYPDGLKTKLSQKDLDAQLNNRYTKLMNNINKIPADYSWFKSKDIKQQLVAAERDWIQYRDAYLNFAVLYYADQYKTADITQITTAYLTRHRLAEINDQISTVNENLGTTDDDNWYKNPW